MEGFEPSVREPKSLALPLGYTPSNWILLYLFYLFRSGEQYLSPDQVNLNLAVYYKKAVDISSKLRIICYYSTDSGSESSENSALLCSTSSISIGSPAVCSSCSVASYSFNTAFWICSRTSVLIG